MARGWESKSIEDQQDAAAERRASAGAPEVSAADAERKQVLDGLHLARVRVLADLQRACRPAHRGMLEQALVDIDAKVAAVRMG